jgi:fructokinase
MAKRQRRSHEANALSETFGTGDLTMERFCRDNAARLGWEAICVARGEQGCAVLMGDQYVAVPGYRVQVADTVGAGDAFAAAFLYGLNSGWPAAEIGDFANRLCALVASRPGGPAPWSLGQVQALSESCHRLTGAGSGTRVFEPMKA